RGRCRGAVRRTRVGGPVCGVALASAALATAAFLLATLLGAGLGGGGVAVLMGPGLRYAGGGFRGGLACSLAGTCLLAAAAAALLRSGRPFRGLRQLAGGGTGLIECGRFGGVLRLRSGRSAIVGLSRRLD